MSEPRFDRYMKSVLERAEVEAKGDSSATIEAQHVLLAMAALDGSDAQRALVTAGLGYEAIKDALHREFAHNLATAGVSLDTFDLPPATPDPSRHPQLSASFRSTMERTMAAHRRGDLRSSHLLLGILEAELGTVPRALALAGVDRIALIRRVRSEP